MSAIRGQFRRVLEGGVPLTDFKFVFKCPEQEDFAPVEVAFEVIVNSRPSTNVHAIIGRNGAGKTTILNSMIEAITKRSEGVGKFYTQDSWQTQEITTDYFSGLVSVSFSAFDPFTPPPDQDDPVHGPRYSYVGLKDSTDEKGLRLKSLNDLHNEFVVSLLVCLKDEGKRKRWLEAIRTLESDVNFSEINLTSLTGDDVHSSSLSTQHSAMGN